LGTVFVEPNALDHHGDIVLTQAGLAAMLASLGALDARLDTRLVFVMVHGAFPSTRRWKMVRQYAWIEQSLALANRLHVSCQLG
jgi:hypothetical protein